MCLTHYEGKPAVAEKNVEPWRRKSTYQSKNMI